MPQRYQVAASIKKMANTKLRFVLSAINDPEGSPYHPLYLRRVLEEALEAFPEPYDPWNFLYLRIPDGLDSLRALPIEELNLAPRISRILKGVNVKTIGDLLRCTADYLEHLPGFGEKSLRELEHRLGKLAGAGLHLAVYDPRLTPPLGYEWFWSPRHTGWRLRESSLLPWPHRWHSAAGGVRLRYNQTHAKPSQSHHLRLLRRALRRRV